MFKFRHNYHQYYHDFNYKNTHAKKKYIKNQIYNPTNIKWSNNCNYLYISKYNIQTL